MRVRIEDIRKGDVVNGKKVVEVLRRFNGYVRLILEGGRDIVDGYVGDMIEVQMIQGEGAAR